MKINLILLILFLSCFCILKAQENITYNKNRLVIKKFQTFDPKQVKPMFDARIINMEAPKPGGSSYRSHLLDVKRKVRQRFPLNSIKTNESGNNSTPQPTYIDSFPLKRYNLIISGLDTLIDRVEYLKGGIPLDNSLAISNDDYLVCGINSMFYMHDLKTGKDTKSADISVISFSNFAQKEGEIATSFPFDPKIIYDPEEDRFVLTFLSGRSPGDSKLILAFSSTNDPTDPWNVYALPGNPFNNGLWSDYPAIVLSHDEVFYTVNLLVPGNDWKVSFNETVIWQIDKKSGYKGNTELTSDIWSDIALDGRNLRNLAVVPGAIGLDGPNMYFLSNRNFDVENDTTFLIEVTNKIDNAAVLKITPLVADQIYGVPPNGRQANSNPNDPNDGFDTNDARVLGAFKDKDEIQFVGNSVNPSSGLAAIYHGFISDLNSNPKIEADIIGDDSLDYGYPNISFTGDSSCSNAAIIGFDHTSPDVFAGVSAIKYTKDNQGVGAYSERMTLKEGEDYVNRINGSYERWGDYFGLQRKYNEPGVVYAAGFYGLTDQNQNMTNYAVTWFSKLRDCECFDVIVNEKILSDYNKCVGQIEAEIVNGIDPVSYLWNNELSDYNYLPVNLCDYSYSLEVKDNYGCSYNTGIVNSKGTNIPSGRNIIFPNPSDGEVNIFFNVKERTIVSVYIFNSEGKLVHQIADRVSTETGSNLLTFSLSPLQAGTYIVKVQESDNIILTEKLIVR